MEKTIRKAVRCYLIKKIKYWLQNTNSADIAGEKNAGIDTCWYNPKNKQNATNIQPNYEIKDFKELLKII